MGIMRSPLGPRLHIQMVGLGSCDIKKVFTCVFMRSLWDKYVLEPLCCLSHIDAVSDLGRMICLGWLGRTLRGVKCRVKASLEKIIKEMFCLSNSTNKMA